MVGMRCIGLACALLLLAACGGDSRSAEKPASPSVAPATAEPASDVNPAMAAPVSMETNAAATEPTLEAAHARRLTDAQSYLNRAREAAEGRHRSAMDNCQRGALAVDFDTCVASAEASLEAELRAARVEFDARMAPAE